MAIKSSKNMGSVQVWFKNRRAKCRQQAKQQQSAPGGAEKSRLLKQTTKSKSPPPARLAAASSSSPSGSPLSGIRESPFKLERSSPAGPSDPLMQLSGLAGGAASSIPSSSYNPIWSPAR